MLVVGGCFCDWQQFICCCYVAVVIKQLTFPVIIPPEFSVLNLYVNGDSIGGCHWCASHSSAQLTMGNDNLIDQQIDGQYHCMYYITEGVIMTVQCAFVSESRSQFVFGLITFSVIAAPWVFGITTVEVNWMNLWLRCRNTEYYYNFLGKKYWKCNGIRHYSSNV